MTMLVTDEEAVQAATWMRDNAGEAAKARAERLYLEQFLKPKRSEIMLRDHGYKSVSSAEMYAFGHPEYAELLAAYKEAVRADEKYRWLKAAADVKIEVWRTLESTRRATEVV